MSWAQYQSKYRQFLISIHQAQITTLAAGAALEGFPRNLPEPISTGLFDAMRTVAVLLEQAIAKRNDQEKVRIQIKADLPDETSPVLSPMLNMYALLLKEGQSPDSVDFESALYRQQLVMVIAHAEAFLGDSVRCVCLAKPRLLESDQKQISWSAALAFPDRQTLVAGLIDNFVGTMMQSKDVAGLLAQLRKTIGLEVLVDSKQLEQFALAEQVRHIIVHNGGRIDRRFCEKTGLRGPIGELFQVDKSFVEAASTAALTIAQSLFISVSQKFLSIADPVAGIGWKIETSAAAQQAVAADRREDAAPAER